MKKHFKYLHYVIRHKWYVFIECCKMGIPFLGIVHDWSKFRPSEWFDYVNHFYGNGETLDLAWLYHQHRNKHHWQFWVLKEDEGNIKIIPMPDKYRKEMLCDWIGAGKAITGNNNIKVWYERNKKNIKMSNTTEWWIENHIYERK